MKTPSFTSLPHYYRATVRRAWRRTQPRLRLRQALVAMLIVALVLTALPLAERFTPPAQAMQGIRPCTNMPYQIIQNCKLGGNNESELENLVINKLLQLHKLPASDRARLLEWERDKIRAGVFDEILSYIKKSPYDGEPVGTSERTADEQAIVTALTTRIKERRILAATKALDEFHRWEVTCPYNPPPPFPPSNETCLAYGGRPVPSFEEFQAYGAALAHSQLLNDPNAVRVQRETALCLATFLGLAAVGIGGGIAFWAGAANLISIASLAGKLFPYAEVSTNALVRGVTIGGPTAVLIFAIIVGTIRGVLLSEELQLPDKLQKVKTDAESKTPELSITAEGLQEVYGEFLVATLPDFPATSGVPTAQASDPQFEVSVGEQNTFTATPTLQYKDWDGNRHTVRMNGRWFVDQKGSEPERLTLSIDYKGFDGHDMRASRAGSRFRIVDFTHEIINSPMPAEIPYLNWDGEVYIARINDSPPTIAAVDVTRPQFGGFFFPLQIATVADADDPAELLTVAVTSPLSSNGITLSDLTKAADGTVKAQIGNLWGACPDKNVNAAFTLQVTDTRGQSAVATVNVTVPANAAPVLTYAPTQSLVVGGSTTITPTSGPSDPDGSSVKVGELYPLTIRPLSETAPPFTGTVTLWRDTSGGFVNPAPTGKININNAGPIGAYRVEVPVTDGCDLPTWSSFTLNVTCAPINVINVVKDPTCYGANNGQITVSASPYPSNFRYSINNGQSFFPTNVFTGLKAGDYDVVVKDADSGCTSAVQRVTLTQPTALSLTPNSLPTAQAGIGFSQSFTASGGTGAKIVSLQGALPAGGGFSPTADGATLAGTPMQTGTFPLTLTVSDQYNCTMTRNVTLTVACPDLTPAPSVLPNAQPGILYNQQLTAGPAGGNYTFAMSSGALPPGLTLQPSGLLTGKPTRQPGAYNFRVTVTGFGGQCGGSRDYQLNVVSCAAILLSPNTLPDGVSGAAYSQNFSASPSGSYSFAVTNGALPPGLTLQSGGQLSGTPLQGGVYTFAVTATDSNNCTGQRTYKLTIGEGGAKAQTAAQRVSGDYDGDGQSDFALWRGLTGEWLIIQSGGEKLRTELWGAANAPYRDVLAPGDYDSDGQSDLAVFRCADGHWYIKQSSDGAVMDKHWGLGTDVPVAADYDGDGKTDIAVWRGVEGTWYILRSSDG